MVISWLFLLSICIKIIRERRWSLKLGLQVILFFFFFFFQFPNSIFTKQYNIGGKIAWNKLSSSIKRSIIFIHILVEKKKKKIRIAFFSPRYNGDTQRVYTRVTPSGTAFLNHFTTWPDIVRLVIVIRYMLDIFWTVEHFLFFNSKLSTSICIKVKRWRIINRAFCKYWIP